MIHQPSGGAQGQATDIQIQAEEILRLKKNLTEIYAKHTKQSYDVLYNHMERDKFMNPEEAKELGIIDTVLHHPPSNWLRTVLELKLKNITWMSSEIHEI